MSLKHLLVCRHGEAEPISWAQIVDEERSLTQNGRAQCDRIQEHLAKSPWSPDLVWCSHSMRTKETFGRIRKAWNQEIPVDEDPGLYLAELPYLKSKILALAPLVRSLMIVGHNPGLSLLVQSLSSEPIDIPTGGMVVLAKELPSWDEAFLTSWSFEAKFLS